jgi:hypothetical protein
MIFALALLAFNALSAPQSGAKKKPAPENRKPVTITLVRWPYT